MTENPEQLGQETATGSSSRTPWLALSGVAAVVGLIVAATLLALILVYYFA